MATEASIQKVQQMYVAYYGRPGDPAGVDYWAQVLDVAGGNWSASIIDAFGTSAEYTDMAEGKTNEELLTALYQQMFNRNPDQAGLDFYLQALEDGTYTLPSIALEVANGAQNEDATTLNYKIQVAEYYTEQVDATGARYATGDIPSAQALLAGVSDDPISVVDGKGAADDLIATQIDEGVEGETYSLKAGLDIIAGTAADDIFKANVVQNDSGAQVNSLGSGDELDGGAGNDLLTAKVTSGVFAGGSFSMPIQPETQDIEVVKLEAVSASVPDSGIFYLNDNGYHGSNNTQVYVNAKDMVDVEQIWSSRSDADLIIQNMTSQGLGHVSEMAVGMEYTGNADTRWGASDYTVYFDQDYLTRERTLTRPTIEILAMNEDAYDATNGELPLAGVFFRELNFDLNGEEFDLASLLGEDPLGSGEEITTYEEFLVAVQAALEQLKAANPDNAALQSIEAELGEELPTDRNPDTLELRYGTAIRLSVEGLTDGVQNTLEIQPTDLEVARAAAATVENNNRYEKVGFGTPLEGAVLSINVALEKVGLAGDGGELIIGSMNKTEYNEWDAVNTVTNTVSGIEEFDVTVYGANDKSSSLAGLHSTNNNLRVVKVVTDANQSESYADLTIGNSNTYGDLDAIPGLDNQYALKDVQIFDASGFKGDLTLYAALTDEITGKYLNLVDEAPDLPSADNVNFEYTGGTGDDTFNVAISADNGAFSGAVTREDFTMTSTIKGGAGNDNITLAIVGNDDNSGPDLQDGDGLAYASFGRGSNEVILANWYDNQRLNANLRIEGGDGDDTIWTPGSGNVVIDAGADNDTVYADNTADKAVWAFNVESGFPWARHQLDNLQSDENNSYQLFKTDVLVSFKGFEAYAAIADVNGRATDLSINQAIKKAINSDPVLSKLLVAKDGPANSLVIESLIDGEMNSKQGPDLIVSLVAPTAGELTAGDLQLLKTYYGTTFATTAAAATFIAQQADLFNDNVDDTYNQVFALAGGDEMVGRNSLHTSDNIITGGLGDDVLVLGTGRLSNDTVVYEDFGNGYDTIVNFSTDDEGNNELVMVGESDDVQEVFTVTFKNLTITNPAAATSIAFDGVTVDLDNNITSQSLIPAVDVAYEFVEQYNANGARTWQAVWNEDATVTFTSLATGDRTDVIAADFALTNATGAPSVAVNVQGTDGYVEAQPAGFVLDLNNSIAIADDTFVFSYDHDDNDATAARTIDIAYKAGDGPITGASKFAAALNASGDWVAVDNIDGTVSVERAVDGEFDIIDNVWNLLNAGEIADATANGVSITINGWGNGSDQVGIAGELVLVESMPLDYVDFTDYDAVGVYVNGGLVTGSDAVAGQNYVALIENPLNAGEYQAELRTEAGATDTLVGIIGTLDFGATQDFVAQNFII